MHAVIGGCMKLELVTNRYDGKTVNLKITAETGWEGVQIGHLQWALAERCGHHHPEASYDAGGEYDPPDGSAHIYLTELYR